MNKRINELIKQSVQLWWNNSDRGRPKY